MKKTTIIFDLDGTLLDTLEDIAISTNLVLKKFGKPPIPVQDYRYLVGEGALKLMQDILPDASEEEIKEALALYEKIYAKRYDENTKLYDGISKLLTFLQKRGFKMAILSNKPNSFTKLCAIKYLKKWNFEAVYGIREDIPRKPDPAGAIEILKEFKKSEILDVVKSLEGELEYEPPIFSAKRINGKRAYDLARAGVEFTLNKINSTIYETKLISYCHPFVTFEATVSEGTYIRSLGRIIASRLGVEFGSLSALERLSEGAFKYNNEEILNIKKSLNIEQNFYTGDSDNLKYGRVIALDDLDIKKDGYYWLDSGGFISVINIVNAEVKYELGRIEC
ncbi:MAG: HAD hydrolase-like protein [Campylobacteraceae bacterium]|nr:HAD hydrolase-like protein [Campylobacteraceae bacterium]